MKKLLSTLALSASCTLVSTSGYTMEMEENSPSIIIHSYKYYGAPSSAQSFGSLEEIKALDQNPHTDGSPVKTFHPLKDPNGGVYFCYEKAIFNNVIETKPSDRIEFDFVIWENMSNTSEVVIKNCERLNLSFEIQENTVLTIQNSPNLCHVEFRKPLKPIGFNEEFDPPLPIFSDYSTVQNLTISVEGEQNENTLNALLPGIITNLQEVDPTFQEVTMTFSGSIFTLPAFKAAIDQHKKLNTIVTIDDPEENLFAD